MKVHDLGNPGAETVLVQMVDGHDLESIEDEVRAVRERTEEEFRLLVMETADWNLDLSPWEASAVFGKDGFGGGAAHTLEEVRSLCREKGKTYYIGGYSLAGLFALWAAYQTDMFRGVAAASPSVWFPGFADYMKENEIRTGVVYLSLGDREERSKNPVLASVGERIREACRVLEDQGVSCTLEWNPGNHFKDAPIRTGKAFAWVMEERRHRSSQPY
ncbi:MAG: esterase [Lachnospiraceae bacterium]|nr:esterase [Lachnospiraceae bacterium]